MGGSGFRSSLIQDTTPPGSTSISCQLHVHLCVGHIVQVVLTCGSKRTTAHSHLTSVDLMFQQAQFLTVLVSLGMECTSQGLFLKQVEPVRPMTG